MSLVLDRSDVAAFGEFLRDARERRGKTLQQVASETRIPRRHLDALEQGQLDLLPGGMYRRAEVRAYADAVGLDRGLALAQLAQVLEAHEAAEAPRTRPTPFDAPSRNWAIYLALALLTAATLWAASRWEVQSAPAVDPPVSEPQPLATTAPPSTVPAPSPSTTPSATPDETSGTAPTAVSKDTPAVPAPVDLTLTVTSSPDGARVLIDGIARGRTPVTVSHLEPGERRVRLVLEGFLSTESPVSLGDRPSTSLHVDLRPAH